MWYTYSVEFYLATTKEENPIICNNIIAIDEPRPHYVQWNKPDTENKQHMILLNMESKENHVIGVKSKMRLPRSRASCESEESRRDVSQMPQNLRWENSSRDPTNAVTIISNILYSQKLWRG